MKHKHKTGHQANKEYQEEKVIIKMFANDFGCKTTETANSIILEKDGKSIEIKQKSKLYKDLQTNISEQYFNARSRLMMFFGCYPAY